MTTGNWAATPTRTSIAGALRGRHRWVVWAGFAIAVLAAAALILLVFAPR